jgi:hypothetical protein
MKEIYKIITEYPNYSISNFGNVKNNKTNKLLKIRFDKGYNRVRLYNKNIANNHSVHKLVGEYFIPNPKNKPEINHIDGNKLNNIVSNLEWNTKSENQTHRYNILHKGSKKISLIKDNVIYSFNSLAECGFELKLDTGNLSRLLNGKYKKLKGYKLYKEKEVQIAN